MVSARAAQLEQLIRQARAAGVRLMMVDLELAMAMLERAAAARDPGIRERNIRNAANAYQTMMRLSSSIRIEESERSKLEGRLKLLRTRLEGFGCPQFSSAVSNRSTAVTGRSEPLAPGFADTDARTRNTN